MGDTLTAAPPRVLTTSLYDDADVVLAPPACDEGERAATVQAYDTAAVTYACNDIAQPAQSTRRVSPEARSLAPQTGAGDCGLPVFMPGGDTPETTAHIVDALASNPAWSVLTQAEHPASTTNRTWYRGDSRCAGSLGDALSCDEYPFYTSRQGGPGASLRLVPGWEQNRQGGYLRNFYAACGIGQGDDYMVAPMPSLPTTTFRC